MTLTMVANLLQIRKLEIDKWDAGIPEDQYSYEKWFSEYLHNGNLRRFRDAIDSHPGIIEKLSQKEYLSIEEQTCAIQNMGF